MGVTESKRTFAILVTGRQDWGILRSVTLGLRASEGMDAAVIAGGMACSPRYGQIRVAIAAEGVPIAASLEWPVDASAAEQSAAAVRGVYEALSALQPEAMVLVGDRFETLAGALGATLARVPLVHLHGGEETEGAIDNVMRHAITKLAHLHLVSHPDHAARVIAMGEHPSTVHVVGGPGLDNVLRDDLPDRAELEAYLGLALVPPVGVVTVHPTTLSEGALTDEVDATLAALRAVDATWVVTLPNADPGNEAIRERLLAFATVAPRAVAVQALGERRYFGLLRLADVVLGNSSSGLVEAPVVGVPTVNVGDRQKGRLRGPSVLDVAADPAAVTEAVVRAISPAFRRFAMTAGSPYGDGRSGARIVEILAGWCPPRPPRKRFWDGGSTHG